MTETDKACEDLIFKQLASSFPTHQVHLKMYVANFVMLSQCSYIPSRAKNILSVNSTFKQGFIQHLFNSHCHPCTVATIRYILNKTTSAALCSIGTDLELFYDVIESMSNHCCYMDLEVYDGLRLNALHISNFYVQLWSSWFPTEYVLPCSVDWGRNICIRRNTKFDRCTDLGGRSSRWDYKFCSQVS